MINGWKVFSFLIVLAVCLGLVLVPGMISAGDPTNPGSGLVGIEAAESGGTSNIRVGLTDSFDVNITVYNPDALVVQSGGIHMTFDSALLNVTGIDNGDWGNVAPFSPLINNTSGDLVFEGYNLPGGYLTTDFLHCTIHVTAKGVSGVTSLNFSAAMAGPADAITQILTATGDQLDWNAVQNATVIIGDVFNITVTSTGCCPIDVGSWGTVAANSTDTFTVPCPNVTLTADDSDVCCDFVNWTWNGNSSTNKLVTVTGAPNSSITAVATCSVPQVNLTMAVSGSGTTSPSGTGSHLCGAVVPINATADPGWRFVNWTTGDMSEIANATAASTTVTVDKDKTVTANFVERFNLTMNVTGSGTTDPAVGGHPYDNGTVVPINAMPAACWDFVNWTGDVADPNSTSTNVTVDANKTVTANFAQVNYTLNINVTVGGNVTINGTTPTSYPNSTSWVNCTVVNLTATPDANYTFVNWTGDLMGSTNPANITIDGDKTVTANFALKWYNLTINSTTGGTVTTPGEGVKGPYIHGTVVNLTAEPDADYAFLEWSGNVSTIDDVNSSTTNITMYDNYSIWAHFGPHNFDVTPRSLTFTTVEGENPPSQTLEICNTGNGTLDWSLSDNKGWLKESPTSGSLAEDDCEDVKVSVDVAGMKAGDYTAKITFTGSLDLEVPVRLHIESAMEAMPVLPAGLSASALSISPQQVQPGQDVTISINVANTGGATGSYNAALYINSVVEDSQTVSVAAGASKNVIFTVSKTAAGVYDVSLAGQSGQFEVVGGGGWFGGGGLGTGGIIAIVVVVIILIVAVIFILRGTARPE